MQMKVINILSEKFDQLVGRGDITDDGYKSNEEWSGEKEGRDPSPLTPRSTPREDKQSILGPEHGQISRQREEKDLRNRSKLITFNLDNFDPVDTTKGSWNTGMEKFLTEMDSVEDTHQNCSSGKDGQVSTQSKNSRNVEPSGIPEKEYHTILVNEEVE